MNIAVAADTPPQASIAAGGNLPADLKQNQVLDAKVISVDNAQNALLLSVAGKTLLLRADQPLNLQAGQALQLQVLQLQPPLFAIGPAPGVQLNPAAPPNLEKLPMDINLPLDVRLLTPAAVPANSLPDLQLNQVLDAKLLGSQALLNTLSLTLADQTLQIRAQTQASLNLNPGQDLLLQVVKLSPSLEFALLAPPQSGVTATGGDPAILKLVSVLPAVLAGPAANLAGRPGPPLAGGQQLQAMVVDIGNGKLSLQLPQTFPAAAGQSAPVASTGSAPSDTAVSGRTSAVIPGSQLLVLDSKQWQFAGASADTPASAGFKPALSELRPGAAVILEVVQTGRQPLVNVSLAPQAADISEQKITELLKQLLPMQASPAVLFNRLAETLPAAFNSPTIAETLKQLAREILAAIPRQPQLADPQQLKQNVAQSGLFLESKLAELLSGRTGITLHEDMKLKLLKLVDTLGRELATAGGRESGADGDDLLKDLLQKANGALAKLTLNQFNSLPNEESAKQGWIMELPFFHQQRTETVRIEIQQEKRKKTDNSEKNWAVMITITPPELATIHCRLSCYDGAVNTRFWSDSAGAVEKINAHLIHLKQQFEQKGLKTGFMEAHQGKPSISSSMKQPLTNLLNEKV